MDEDHFFQWLTSCSLLVANITFVVAEIIIKEDVSTFSVVKITNIVAEITGSDGVMSSSAECRLHVFQF